MFQKRILSNQNGGEQAVVRGGTPPSPPPATALVPGLALSNAAFRLLHWVVSLGTNQFDLVSLSELVKKTGLFGSLAISVKIKLSDAFQSKS